MHLLVDIGRNRLREAFQDLIVAASIAHHDCRDGKQHLMRRESRTRKLLMYKKAVDSPVAVLERMYKHKPETIEKDDQAWKYALFSTKAGKFVIKRQGI